MIWEYFSKKYFRWVHENNLLYNQCWEDPRLDRVALQLSPSDSVAMISSAGCNALDYALEGPRHIYAVDMNPRQNALLDLKIAAIRALEYDDFFALFGKGQHSDVERLYKEKLRPALPAISQKIWDEHWDYFTPKRSGQGLYFRGSAGLAAWLVNHYMSLKKLRHLVFEIFEAANLDEQKRLYEKIHALFWSKTIERSLNSDVGMSLLGVPRAQRRYLEKTYDGRISNFVQDCLRRVFTEIPLHDNYFWWLYLNGAYSAERCPEYLKEENFYKLKGGRVNCIETHTCSMADFLEDRDEAMTRYVLLDHMDWLADAWPAELEREWRAIAASAAPRARILFRSGGSEVRYLDDIQVPTRKGKRALQDSLAYDRELAARLHAQDRVHTYGCFCITEWLC